MAACRSRREIGRALTCGFFRLKLGPESRGKSILCKTDRSDLLAALIQRITTRSATVAVIGLGYVGLPLAACSPAPGFRVIGFDIDPAKVEAPQCRRAPTSSTSPTTAIARDARRRASRRPPTSPASPQPDAILICVPTPLSRNREPDLSYVVDDRASRSRRICAPGQLVVLESTTYPGTTRRGAEADPRSASGLRLGRRLLPRLLAGARGSGQRRLRAPRASRRWSAATGRRPPRLAARALRPVRRAHWCRCPRPTTAEAVKLTENIFRAVNIALVNELKVVYDAMGIDVWEVIEAAQDQAVRLHAVLSRARASAGTASRSIRST